MATILSSICDFLIENKADILSKVLASASYDALKSAINFSSLKSRISGFFKSEDKAEEFVKSMCERPANNPHKPHRDIEDTFENVTNESYDEKLYNEVRNWVIENAEDINKVATMNFSNQSGFNIGEQKAGRDIYNIQGNYNKGKKDKDGN